LRGRALPFGLFSVALVATILSCTTRATATGRRFVSYVVAHKRHT